MVADDWLTSSPIAHRGLYDSAAGVPENSLAAFQRAVSYEIPFELDVQRSEDGLLLVVHDANISLMSGEFLPVEHVTRGRLRNLRLESFGHGLATLGQVLELVDGRVPIMVDVRRWRPSLRAELETGVADETRGYDGPLAFQAYDPLAVHRLRRFVRDRPVGQISGVLRAAGPIATRVGRTMATNLVTRPDFVSYELTLLPSASVDFWRRRGMPLVAFPVRTEAEERRATALADNYFFAEYLPARYRNRGGRKEGI